MDRDGRSNMGCKLLHVRLRYDSDDEMAIAGKNTAVGRETKNIGEGGGK